MLTCENETARAELTCCDAEKLARAQARGVKLNNATPFTMGNHAHGILSYFHVRQGFREVAAYEARRGKRYDWIVRTRPDVLPLLPLGAELFLQRLDPDRVSVPYKKPGIPGVLADWFFAVPRRLADWFFEVALLGCLKHNEINGGFDVSQRKTCFFGEIYHAPEYLLGPYVKRHLGSPRGGLSDGTGLFPVALMRKRPPPQPPETRTGMKKHRDPAEERRGIYELECELHDHRWPPAVRQRCYAIDDFLHRAPAALIESLPDSEPGTMTAALDALDPARPKRSRV